MHFQSDQPAATAHAQLQAAIQAMNQAEHCAVLWFADIDRRGLYRDLGYSSMQQYATVALKFSKTRMNDFLRLARRLDDLPTIRRAVASGDLGYTKAREIVKVASAKTEGQWLATAAASTRRDLEQKVARVRQKARRRSNPAQPEMLPAAGPEQTEAELAAAVPVRVGLTLTAEQFARYEALWQKLDTIPNAEDLLEALAVLVEERTVARTGTSSRATDSRESTCEQATPRGAATAAASTRSYPPVQIHVHQCPDCGATEAAGHALDRTDRDRLACDAVIARPGRRNTTTIAPRIRREVLARDRHRCQAPGCSHTRFLEVHHLTPRAQGGRNDPENLITLCASCHRLWHQRP